MVIALVGLALAMIAGGAWGIVTGYEIIIQERGWTLVIAGTAVASFGMMLLGIAAAVARLGGIRGELGRLRERAERPQPNYPEPPSHVMSPAGLAALSVFSPPVAENKREVLGTHSSGANRYVMFSDGSVEAETPDGSFRFSSLSELQGALASGGGGLQGGR